MTETGTQETQAGNDQIDLSQPLTVEQRIELINRRLGGAAEDASDERTEIHADDGDEGGHQEDAPAEGEEAGEVKEQPEKEAAIEYPFGWKDEEKPYFDAMDEATRAIVLRTKREQDAYFTRKSQEDAHVRELTIREGQKALATINEALELQALLMPIEFQEIKTQQDFIKLKVDDPERAARFEALGMSIDQLKTQQKELQQKQAPVLAKGAWDSFLETNPALADENKGRDFRNKAFKCLADNYGLSPSEVPFVGDARHWAIIKDAMAYREHLVKLANAEAKKSKPAPEKVVRKVSPQVSEKSQMDSLLAKMNSTTDMRQKAEYLAQIRNIQARKA